MKSFEVTLQKAMKLKAGTIRGRPKLRSTNGILEDVKLEIKNCWIVAKDRKTFRKLKPTLGRRAAAVAFVVVVVVVVVDDDDVCKNSRIIIYLLKKHLSSQQNCVFIDLKKLITLIS